MGLIRVFLALSVVLWHIHEAPQKLLNGAVAVLLFFVISGFYMAMVINEKYALQGDRLWIRRFYAARAWRLYPAYWATMILGFAWYRIGGNINVFDLSAPGALVKHIATAFSNLFILGQDVHQFLVRVRVEHAAPPAFVDWLGAHGGGILADYYMLVGQAWSLSSELWFYAIAPFIVTSRKRTLICLATALALRFFLLTVCDQRSGIWGNYFFPGAVSMFLLGSASYHLQKMLPRPDLHAWVGCASLVAFFGWIAYVRAGHAIVLPSRSDWSVDEPRFWCLYIPFALAVPFIFQFTRKSSLDRQLGDLSYPLYLIHGILIGILIWWKVPFGHMYVSNAVITVILCVMAAFALNRIIEIPAERLRIALTQYLRPPRSPATGDMPTPARTDAA
jgi:peptidoglycan/LPS O-acetylase OafA/YrhL